MDNEAKEAREEWIGNTEAVIKGQHRKTGQTRIVNFHIIS